MSLRLVPPPPDDFENWKRLLNLLFILEEDRLFEWLRLVREEIVRVEREKRAA